jgi:hypothetical protein
MFQVLNPHENRRLMRKIGFLITWVFLLNSCDPYQLVYIRNFSKVPIVVDVYLTKKYPYPRPDKLNSKDSVFEDKKDLFEINFANQLSIKNINDSVYQAIVPQGSTNLLEPVCMGFPIRKVVLKSNENLDSVIFSGINHNLRQAKKKGILQKVSISTFVIDFEKSPTP